LPSFSSSRRKFLGLGAAAGVAAVAADSVLIEPNRPVIERKEIALRRWPVQLEGFTIALISDLHYDPHFSAHPLRASVGMVNGLHPDLIAITGDFVTQPLVSDDDEKAASAAEPCSQLVGEMRATHGVWAVLGNHDWFTDPVVVSNALRAQGVRILGNSATPIEVNGSRFWLAGVNDVMSQTADLHATLSGVPSDEPTVMLVHEPDFADRVARHPVDLQLSGHSHGGQVRFPFLPPLYLPHLAKKYYQGLYKIGDLTLYTNRGLGTIVVPVRIDCPPEITWITLRRAAS
jgi:uncharacterized protein